MLPIPNDEPTLIARAQSDPQAFALLYDRYVERVYAYAFRQSGDESLAQDITAATFEKALRHLQRYRWQGQSFCAWLYRIARNESIACYRKQRWLVPLGWALRPAEPVEQAVQRHHQHATLLAALARLSSADRQVLTLRFFEELSSAEVAEVVGCSLPNVYLRLHRALARLRREVDRLERISGETPYVPS